MFRVHAVKIQTTWRVYYRGDKPNCTVIFAPAPFWRAGVYKTRKAVLRSAVSEIQ